MLKLPSLPLSALLLRLLAVALCVGLFACDDSEETGENIGYNCNGDLKTGSTSTISIWGSVIDGPTGASLPSSGTGSVLLYDSLGVSLIGNSTLTSSGGYSFSGLNPSWYILKSVLNNYTVVPDKKCLTASENLTLTAVTTEKATNANVIVLTWGDQSSGAPEDLDSHLQSSGGSGSPAQIKYNARGSSSGWAMLDLDDTSYSGPETVTVNLDSSSGPMRNSVTKACYYVRIFTTGYSFSQTKAQVQIFQSDGTVLTNFNAPTDTTYTSKPYWHVFDLDSNLNITTKNTVSSSAPSCS